MSTTRKRSRSPANTLVPSDDWNSEQAFSVDNCEKAVDSNKPELFSLDDGIVASISPVRPKLPPCRYFQQGSCSAGSSCRFAHAVRADTFEGLKKLDLPCQFYARGLCREGANCRFSHSIPASKDVNARPLEAEPALCKFYQSLRGCKNANCPFKHVAPADAQVITKITPTDEASEEAAKILEKYSSTKKAETKGVDVEVRRK